MAAKLVLTLKDDSKNKLLVRSEEQTRTDAPLVLQGADLSVLILRGFFSRISLCLPAYYHFLGAISARDVASKSNDYPFRVTQSYLEFSSLNTLTLSCRKIFDTSIKNSELTGAKFSKFSDSVLEEHAEIWAKHSSRNKNDAITALSFLKRFFSECSKTDTNLLRSKSPLQKRIGLLKQHANRSAAHLSVENYSLDITDLTHFIAACVVVGEIIRSFDKPHLANNYFNELDTASYQAAKRVFPQIEKFQLFANWSVETQATLYWQWGEDHGIQMLLYQIQHVIGGDPIEES